MAIRIPSWWWAVASTTVAVVLVIELAYLFGASGIEFSGAQTSFDREHDKVLFAVDERRGFVTRDGRDVALVQIAPGTFPFRPVCGRCELDGSVFNLAQFLHDDWVYTSMPHITDVDAINLRTGETLQASLTDPGRSPEDAAQIPEFAAHGLDFADDKRLDLGRLASLYPDGRLINESCIVVQMAAIVALGIVAALGLVLLATRGRRA
ncbi:MAG: hypothetical protein K1X88_26825 [Nannocystaceae bacterium]|nr:hypothetical protein [Nannocystaceae bacterium]